MPRAYISARVKDELRIRQLRDQLWTIIDGGRFYKKKTPHITVIPPFTVEPGYEDDVESLVEDCPLEGREVKINTLGVYENIKEPYVVLLDVDVEIEDVREELLEELPKYTEGNIIDPVRPHMTLFKTQGWWDDIDDEVKHTLQQEILHRKSFSNTQVKRVEVDFKT